MSHDEDVRKANAEAKFKRRETQATEGAQAKADHDASIVARDANMARLKELRLAKEAAERASADGLPAKRRGRKVQVAGDMPTEGGGW